MTRSVFASRAESGTLWREDRGASAIGPGESVGRHQGLTPGFIPDVSARKVVRQHTDAILHRLIHSAH